jgi:hypothetical protein
MLIGEEKTIPYRNNKQWLQQQAITIKPFGGEEYIPIIIAESMLL